MSTCTSCGEPFPVAASFRFCPSCAAPARSIDDPLLGQTLAGRYVVTARIGEGGMGRVYAAEQAIGATRRRVAVKVLLPAYTEDRQLVGRFLNEIGLVATLEHPNTVRVHDSGRTERGQLFVVMELVSGVSLSHAIASGPLPPARLDGIVAQICGSLDEAHRKGIVHRDLKPDNVLLTNIGGDDDVVKVVDFGIAQGGAAHPDGSTRLTKHGEILGTPAYMSPEQFGGGEIDARSDVYALGVMAYEMACGRLPFAAEGLAQWALAHASAPPAPFDATRSGAAVPANMRAAILRALSKNPEARQQTMRELYAELTIFGDRASMAPWSRGRASAAALATVPAAPIGSGLVTEPAMVRSLETAVAPGVRIPAPPSTRAASGRGPTLAVVGGAAALLLLGATVWLARGGGGQSVGADSAIPASPPLASPAPTVSSAPIAAAAPTTGTIVKIDELLDVGAPPPPLHPCALSLQAKAAGADCSPIREAFKGCTPDHPRYREAKRHLDGHCLPGGHHGHGSSNDEHKQPTKPRPPGLIEEILGTHGHDDHDD